MTIRTRLRRLLTRLVDRLDDRISRRSRAAARDRGHTVTRIPGTRTDSYRDEARMQQIRALDAYLAAATAAQAAGTELPDLADYLPQPRTRTGPTGERR